MKNTQANGTYVYDDEIGTFHIGQYSAISIVNGKVYEARHSGAFQAEFGTIAPSALIQGF